MFKAFSEAVARAIAAADPAVVANMPRPSANGRIFLDNLRTAEAHRIAPYSTRARAVAPVSTPVALTELSANLKPTLSPTRTCPAASPS